MSQLLRFWENLSTRKRDQGSSGQDQQCSHLSQKFLKRWCDEESSQTRIYGKGDFYYVLSWLAMFEQLQFGQKSASCLRKYSHEKLDWITQK